MQVIEEAQKNRAILNRSQAIKKVPFLMGGADPLKFCGIFGRGSGRGSVFSRYAL